MDIDTKFYFQKKSFDFVITKYLIERSEKEAVKVFL